MATGVASNYLAKKLMDHVFGATAFTAPATVYAALWTATLDDTSTGATAGECSGTNYARVAITNNSTNFPAASGTPATKSNANAITFATPGSGGWGTATYMALLDNATVGAGNILFYIPLSSSQTINAGDTVSFASSSVAFTFNGNMSDYLKKKLLDLALSATAYSAPANTYVGLWNATLADASTSATAGELSGNAYARVTLTNNTTNWPNATGTTTAAKSNGTTVSFPTPTPSGWGSFTDVAVCDVASGAGNILVYGHLTGQPITANAGNTVQFAATALAITLN